MRYNPYNRRRRLNSSLQPNYDVLTQELVAKIVNKKYGIGLADMAKFECNVYTTSVSYYLTWKLEIGRMLGIGSDTIKLVDLEEATIQSACETADDQINNCIQNRLTNVIKVELSMALDDAGYSSCAVDVSEIYRYEDWIYACDINVAIDGYVYSDSLHFELDRESIARDCSYLANDIVASM